MRNFNRDNNRGGSRSGGRDSGGRGFGGRSFGGDRDGRKPSMHKAKCDECGSFCEVPFRPTGDRPVYCSECFKHQGDGDSKSFGGRDRDSGGRGFGRDSGRSSRGSDFGEKRMYTAICDECEEECEVPFRPTEGKPVYCSECFGKGDHKEPKESKKAFAKGGSDNVEQLKKQFDVLNSKLDQILKVLSANAPVKKVVEEKKIEKIEVPAPKKEVKKTVAKKEVVAKKAIVKKIVVKKVAKKK